MPFASIVSSVVMTALGILCVYFAVDYNRRRIQNTPHVYNKPSSPQRQNSEIIAGYDSNPQTSNQGEGSTVYRRKCEKCAICLEEVEKGFLGPCKHRFHKKCIEKWEKALNSSLVPCPVCRVNLLSS